MSEPEAPSVWVQWKGTSLCADFRCTCSRRGHIDDDFCYAVECEACGQKWVLPQTLTLTRIEDAGWQPDARPVSMDDPNEPVVHVDPAIFEGLKKSPR